MKKTLELDFSNKASNVSITSNSVSKTWGVGLGWTRGEAEAVLADHTQYLDNLQSVGIQTSKIISRDIFQTNDGTFAIKEVEAYSGKDISIVLLEAADTKGLVEIVENDFRATARLLLSIPPREGGKYSKEQPWFKVPVDLKPQNVVIEKLVNRPIVVDTFGPKLWREGKIKPLPTRTAGKGQIEHDEIKVGDIRFALGRLNGYFVALSTRWLVSHQPGVSVEEIDNFRFKICDTLIGITREILTDNPLFEPMYAEALIADASETELKSVKFGSYEGPRYVQVLYEQEEANSLSPIS